jgi:hypothetical protein
VLPGAWLQGAHRDHHQRDHPLVGTGLFVFHWRWLRPRRAIEVI